MDSNSWIVKNYPYFLIGGGMASMVAASVLAVKDTPNFYYKMASAKEEQQVDKLSKKEIFKMAVKNYAIPLSLEVSGMGLVIAGTCIIGSRNAKLNSALATTSSALATTTSAFATYQKKVAEELGERNATKVKDAVAKEKLKEKENDDEKNGKVREVIITERGSTLMYDSTFGRYFKGDIDDVKRIVNKLNNISYGEDFVTVNDFYRLLDLDTFDQGDNLGWDLTKGPVTIDFSAQLSKNDEPICVISYNVVPYNTYS